MLAAEQIALKLEALDIDGLSRKDRARLGAELAAFSPSIERRADSIAAEDVVYDDMSAATDILTFESVMSLSQEARVRIAQHAAALRADLQEGFGEW